MHENSGAKLRAWTACVEVAGVPEVFSRLPQFAGMQ
jgi:hypothetical protein